MAKSGLTLKPMLLIAVVMMDGGITNFKAKGAKNMKRTAMALALISSAAIANDLPQPDEGIKIMPRAKWNDTGHLKTDVATYAQQNTNGFIKIKSERAQELISLSHTLKAQKLIDMPKFAFDFPSMPNVENLGYYPTGTIRDGKWTGGVQLFKSKIGMCSLTVNAIKHSHGSVHLAEEVVRYDVHSKPTMEFVSGTDKTGYTYVVSWFDDTYFRDLECATDKYKAGTLSAVVALAESCDKN